MLATSAGIGLFLAFTGLQATQGLGLSVYSTTTAVTIGASPCQHRAPRASCLMLISCPCTHAT